MKVIIIGDIHLASPEDLIKLQEAVKALSLKKGIIILTDNCETAAKEIESINSLRNQKLIMEITKLEEEAKENMIFPISKPKYNKKAAEERERAKAVSSKRSNQKNIRHVGKSWATRKSRKKFN